MILHQVTIDMVPGGPKPEIWLNQYDSDFTIRFDLVARRGEFTAPTGTTAAIRGTKPDGNGFSADAVINGSTVTVTGDQQMTVVAGKAYYELTLYKNGKELNTANFILNVERAALDMDTPTSRSQTRELVALEERADEIIAAVEHVSDAEAYAIGTRDGEPVPSTDPAYNNSAKYWAEHASGENLAPQFSTSTAYAVGDYVLYNNQLYRFTSAHAAGAWNAAHATAVTTMGEVTDLKGDLSQTVKFTAQTLTDAQKAQAKTNLGIDNVTIELDKTLTQEDMASESASVGTALNLLGETLTINSGLINYGYDFSQKYDAPASEPGGRGVGSLSFFRYGPCIGVDGTSGDGYGYASFAMKINGSGFSLASNPNSLGSLPNPLTLENGTTYRITLKKLSGTCTKFPSIKVVDYQGSTDLCTLESSSDDKRVYTFTVGSSAVNIGFMPPTSATYSDAQFYIELEEKTESGGGGGGGSEDTDDSVIFSGTTNVGQAVFDNTKVSVGDVVFYDFTVTSPSVTGYLALNDSNGNRLNPLGIGKLGISFTNQHNVGAFKIPSGFAQAIFMGTNNSVTINVKYFKTRIDFDEIARDYEELYYEGKIDLLSVCGYYPNQALIAKTNEFSANSSYSVTSPMPVIPHSKLTFLYTPSSKSIGVAYYDGTQQFVNGETSLNKTVFEVPDGCYFVRATVPNNKMSVNKCYLELPLSRAVNKSIETQSLYKRCELHRYGTMLNGRTHNAFPKVCLFDNKIYVNYRSAMMHIASRGGGDGITQFDIVELDGSHVHKRAISKLDFGIADSALNGDMGTMPMIPSLDGQYLLAIAAGSAYSANPRTPFAYFTVFDKNLNILSYKQVPNVGYTHGNIIVTPSGKVAFTSYNNNNGANPVVYLHISESPFSGSADDISFARITLVDSSETTIIFTEPCLGYFNNKLVLLVRTDSNGVNQTIIKVTENLEATDGWSELGLVNGGDLHAPNLLTYAKGKYLPVVGSLRRTSDRIPVIGFIDVDNKIFKCLKNIDDTLITAENGYPTFEYFGGDEYIVAYFQETPGNTTTISINESYAGVYLKRINVRTLISEMRYWDIEDNN